MTLSTPLRLIGIVLTGILSTAAAQAAGTPNLGLTKSAPATQLYGTKASVTLTASVPSGQPSGYNVSFRDVLPPGVHYVAATSVPTPKIIANEPGTGQTTLIWSNLADLSPGSTGAISYQVSHDTSGPTVLRVGDTYTNQASAYVNTDPRLIAKFDATGAPIASSFTGSAAAAVSTTLVPVKIAKSEPSAEAELLRGVHDHQTVYTLTVTNNLIDDTTGVTIDDYLQAGLEFLGCGAVDNTKNAPTNPGSPEEFPGAGHINGHAAAPAGCLTPTLVETVQTDPDGAGTLPSAVYTHVRWTVPDLAAGQSATIRYLAAIPIRQNTLDWNGAAAGAGTTPAATGAQTANLDNNSGPEVRDETLLTNLGQATGTYTGATKPGTAKSVATSVAIGRVSEDLLIHKTVDHPIIAHGDITSWKLDIETSEYRSARAIDVIDTLPNGLCPLGAANFEHTPPVATAECAPAPGVGPTTPYASNPIENANGTWTIDFKPADLPVNGKLLITFPARVRSSYQLNYAPTTPVLAGDTWQNVVNETGTIDARLVSGAKIDHDAAYDGVTAIDFSSASQSSSGPLVEKWVAKDGTVTSATCPATAASYTKLAAQAQSYGPGDIVCYRVRVQFSTTIDTKIDPITDFIPVSEDYVAGSVVAGPDHTLGAGALTATWDGTGLRFTNVGVAGTGLPAGVRVVPKSTPAPVFDVFFAARVNAPQEANPGDLIDNLVKFATRNTKDQSFPSRADVAHGFNEARLSLLKGVARIVRAGVTIAGPNGPNVDHLPVKPGDVATFRIDVSNIGTRDATGAQVWDVLAPGVVCADISNVSAGGACGAQAALPGKVVIAWSGLAIAKASSLSVTYDMLIRPNVFAPGEDLQDHAGVRQFQTTTNVGGTFVYVPLSNIDSSQAASANTDAADDLSDVFIDGNVVTKSRLTALGETGNALADQATIGENVTYTVDITLPGNTVLVNGVLNDAIPAALVLDQATVQATVNGAALPAGWALTSTAASVRLTLPASYAVPTAGTRARITFTARVADSPANVRGATITNSAALTWTDAQGVPRSSTSSVPTTVVEPAIAVAKAHAGTGPFAPGAPITYTVTVANPTAANVSTGHDLTVVDTVPAGLCVVRNATSPSNGGVVTGTACAGEAITWTLAQLAPGTFQSFTYGATINTGAVAGAAFANHVAATESSMPGAVPGERGYNASANDSVTAVAPTIAKTVGPTTATQGTSLGYTIQVGLPAGLALAKAHIDDALPAGIVFDSETSVACTPVPCGIAVPNPPTTTSPLSWSLGDVAAAAATRTITIAYAAHVAAAATSGAKTNTATLGWTVAGTTQSVSATATTTVGAPLVRINKHVSCDGTVPPRTDTDSDVCTVTPGDAETYSLVVRNDGSAPAYDIAVVDTPPAGLIGIAGISNGGVLGAGAITWTLPGPLAVGGAVTLTYTAQVGPAATVAAGQKLTNTASIPDYFGLPATERAKHPADAKDFKDGGSDSVTLTVSYIFTDLSVAKSGTATVRPGGVIAYDVAIANAGPAVAVNSQVVDTVPAGLAIDASSLQIDGTAATLVTGAPANAGECNVTGQIISCALGNMAAPSTKHLTFSVAVPVLPTVLASYTNQASVATSTIERDTTNNGASFTTTVPWADVRIAKTSSTPVQGPGGQVVWTLTITNAGPSTATGVTVTDTLPAGVTASGVSANPAAGVSCQPGPPIACGLPDLAPGAVVTLLVTTTVNATAPVGSTLTNVGVVGAVNDTDSSNNRATADVIVVPQAIKQADVQITKSAKAPTVKLGQNATFTLTVRNNGPDPATSVIANDVLPAGTVTISVKPSVGTCTGKNPITCKLGTLAVGASVQIVVVVRPSKAGTFVNGATVTTSATDTNPANNRASARVVVKVSRTKIWIRKVANKRIVTAGGLIRYALVLRVVANVAAVNVKVCDTLPTRTTFVSAPGATFSLGRICWTRALVKAHGSLRFSVVLRVDKDAPRGRIRNTVIATASNAPSARGRAGTIIRPAGPGGVGGVTG